MKFANATKLDRKSGVAKWRDLRFQSLARPLHSLRTSNSAHQPDSFQDVCLGMVGQGDTGAGRNGEAVPVCGHEERLERIEEIGRDDGVAQKTVDELCTGSRREP
jgi:hypothetical protein